MLLVTFADDAFAQRRVGGVYRGGVARGPAFRGAGVYRGGLAVRRAGFVGPARVGYRGGVVRRAGWVGPARVGWRGGVVRRAAWGGYPGWRYRRAVVGAGLIGVGVGAWGYPGYLRIRLRGDATPGVERLGLAAGVGPVLLLSGPRSRC